MGYGSIYERDEHLVFRNGRLTRRYAIENRIPTWGTSSDVNESLSAYLRALRTVMAWPLQGPESARVLLTVDEQGHVHLRRPTGEGTPLVDSVRQAIRRLPPFTPGMNRGAMSFTITGTLRRTPR